MLTREQILAADDLPREQVEVPEWGGSVWVRTLTVGQREQWEQTVERHKGNTAATIVVMTACDETGSLLFTEADIPALSAKSAGAVNRIMDVATKLAKVSKEDQEELKKNSTTTPSESSPSS
jgi:hypothetical protein